MFVCSQMVRIVVMFTIVFLDQNMLLFVSCDVVSMVTNSFDTVRVLVVVM